METQFLMQGSNLIIASVLVLALGKFLNSKIPFLSHYNIPVPVTGGLLCSIVLTLLYVIFDIRIDFDMQLRNLLLLTFFSTIGLSAKLNTLISGGKTLVVLLAFAILLLVFQDIVGIVVALLLDSHPAYGLFAGSISFAGGHGTAIAWGEVAEEAGLQGAASLGIACATFGLVAGGILGGPLGGYLMKKHDLSRSSNEPQLYEVAESNKPAANVEKSTSAMPLDASFTTLLLLALCVGIGVNINDWLAGVGISLPPFLTAMFVGIVLTNLADVFKWDFNAASVNRAGEISLQLFLAMSLMSVQLWQLANAIGPLLLVLMLQMLVISCLAVFLVFRFTGKDYDACIIASGFLGLGLGATPVAIANMQALTSRYGPSTKAFIVVPLVGAFFMDLSNAMVIKAFFMLPMMEQILSALG
ncbi:MAG: sodium/glutamate symporter [Pseudomonadales bacterium]|nr:sodium/glutamate symporter [Pseudomonadales bacterium]